jgi:hypothetical protein
LPLLSPTKVIHIPILQTQDFRRSQSRPKAKVDERPKNDHNLILEIVLVDQFRVAGTWWSGDILDLGFCCVHRNDDGSTTTDHSTFESDCRNHEPPVENFFEVRLLDSFKQSFGSVFRQTYAPFLMTTGGVVAWSENYAKTIQSIRYRHENPRLKAECAGVVRSGFGELLESGIIHGRRGRSSRMLNYLVANLQTTKCQPQRTEPKNQNSGEYK